MANNYKISGHEKFAFREGWLTKGIDLLVNGENDLFSEESSMLDGSAFNDSINATDKLGVGANMVKSIRYWMIACGLLEKSGNKFVLTETAKIIYLNDKYFEDTFTWWIIHSNLAKSEYDAAVWNLFFNKITAEVYTKDEIVNELKKELDPLMGGTCNVKSLKDSVDVLLKMYAKQNSRNEDPEDKNICPLVYLGLIKKDKNEYVSQQPDLRLISSDLILYELSSMFKHENDISIDRIYSGKCGVKNIYHINKMVLNQILDELETKGFIRITRTAGLDVVYADNMPEPSEIIKNHYR